MTRPRSTKDDPQTRGTHEFDEAIALPDPKIPPMEADKETDQELDEALRATFPASDPVAVAAAEPDEAADKD